MAEWDGTERRENTAALELAREAATIAAQDVARIHRKRLVRQAFFAAMVVSSAVAVLAALVVIHVSTTNLRHNAAYNCQTNQAATAFMADFVRSDAALRRRQYELSQHEKDVQRAFARLFGAKRLAQLEAESARVDRVTTDRWLKRDLPGLQRIADVSCGRALQ